MKSLQQDYNSLVCSSLLMLSSAVFSMGDDRKHLQASCGLCHKAVPLLRRPCRSPKGTWDKLCPSKTTL